MKYSITILKSAQKQLKHINLQDQKRIILTIESLAYNPRPEGCKKLTGRPIWRIRVGSYRIIYEINDDTLCILIVTIGHRRDVYSA